MPAAKTAAKETHEAARDAKSAKDVVLNKREAAVAAAHAMGQIIGIVHVGTHATAYAAYCVQAVVHFNHGDDPEETLQDVAARLEGRLAYWAAAPKDHRPWVRFL